MKPFNLEKALAGSKVITRDGREVSELHYLKTCLEVNSCIVAVIEGGIIHYYENGKLWKESASENDLFMAPEIVKKWVNVYPTSMFNSKEEAEMKAFSDLTTTIEIEVEN